MSFEIKKVALVGANTPLSPLDHVWQNFGLQRWREMGCRIAPDVCFDAINLNDGRDFLREKETYDAVVLMNIFNGSGPNFSDISRKSDLHTIPNWLKRLKNTQAMLIDVFHGCNTEFEANVLSQSLTPASFAHDLPEYNRVHYQNESRGSTVCNPSLHVLLVKPEALACWLMHADPDSFIGKSALITAATHRPIIIPRTRAASFLQGMRDTEMAR